VAGVDPPAALRIIGRAEVDQGGVILCSCSPGQPIGGTRPREQLTG
jgi:hypothetical protein